MALFKFDHKTEPMASGASFAGRMFTNLLAALIIVALALAVGMYGYQEIEGMAWIDAFLNSAMLLGGMGPVDAPRTDGGKLFAGVYALYAGLAFVVLAGLLVAPFLHRLLHKFHWESDGDSR